jgi:hypothetical protein
MAIGVQPRRWTTPEIEKLTIEEVVDLAQVKVAFSTYCSCCAPNPCPDVRPPK